MIDISLFTYEVVLQTILAMVPATAHRLPMKSGEVPPLDNGFSHFFAGSLIRNLDSFVMLDQASRNKFVFESPQSAKVIRNPNTSVAIDRTDSDPDRDQLRFWSDRRIVSGLQDRKDRQYCEGYCPLNLCDNSKLSRRNSEHKNRGNVQRTAS